MIIMLFRRRQLPPPQRSFSRRLPRCALLYAAAAADYHGATDFSAQAAAIATPPSTRGAIRLSRFRRVI
jgi:hypothetical protein